MIIRIIVCTAALLTAMASAQAGEADAARGKTLYFNVGCAACHGGEGQGAVLTGPRIAPDPAPLPAFRNFVRTPANIMPPYSAQVLSDGALADIHAYLAAIAPPPAASEIFGGN